MDALLAAAVAAAPDGAIPLILLLPTAAARHRPDLAAATGERAFAAAAGRAGRSVEIGVVGILRRTDAMDPRTVERLDGAHLVHLPGGDPDVIPAVLRGSPAWAAILRAHARGACVAGASAGAMALAGRCWTRDGIVEGLGLLPGFAVLPHYAPGRLAGWRDGTAGERPLSWLGLDEQTMVIGQRGREWRVAGRGRVRVIPAPGGGPTRSAGPGELLEVG